MPVISAVRGLGFRIHVDLYAFGCGNLRTCAYFGVTGKGIFPYRGYALRQNDRFNVTAVFKGVVSYGGNAFGQDNFGYPAGFTVPGRVLFGRKILYPAASLQRKDITVISVVRKTRRNFSAVGSYFPDGLFLAGTTAGKNRRRDCRNGNYQAEKYSKFLFHHFLLIILIYIYGFIFAAPDFIAASATALATLLCAALS